MAGPIIVGVGGADSGREAADTAARVAGLMGVPLVLVFGYESAALAPRGGALADEVSAIGEEALDEMKARIAASHPGLTVETQLVRLRPVDALIAVAAERGAEAIVVGHGGSGPIRAALLGSITYEMVHRAPIPVLVVPDDEE